MDTHTRKLVNSIIKLGSDDKERASALGVSQRTITDYKAGKVPRIVLSLMRLGIIRVQDDSGEQRQCSA